MLKVRKRDAGMRLYCMQAAMAHCLPASTSTVLTRQSSDTRNYSSPAPFQMAHQQADLLPGGVIAAERSKHVRQDHLVRKADCRSVQVPRLAAQARAARLLAGAVLPQDTKRVHKVMPALVHCHLQ